MTAAVAPPIKTIRCPFRVLVDTREQRPFTFSGTWDSPLARGKLITIETIRATVPIGDYSIEGMTDRIGIERKSKEDIYGSIAQRRANFVERLERMSKIDFAAVVVEAEWAELLSDPPRHTQYRPKSLSRTILAWMTRYPVHWIMAPSREHAEKFTFRLLERFWIDQQERPRERFDPGLVDGTEAMSDPDAEDAE